MVPVPFPCAGTAEDAALLLADAGGAAVVVLAGSHHGLVEFLDSGRSAMASAFLTRLRVGPRLLDARTAARLHRAPLAVWHLVLLIARRSAGGRRVGGHDAGRPGVARLGRDAFGSLWHDIDTFVSGLF